MEVTKRYPLLSMYQGTGDSVSRSSLSRSSHSWFEWVNRRLYKKPEVGSQFCFLEGPYSSVVPIPKVLGTPEEPIVYYCPTDMPRYSSWKSSIEHLKLPMTYPALPDPCMVSENKSRGILNSSLVREITQKLLSICHLQHFCDLVSGLVNAVSVSHNMLMASKNSVNVTKMTENNLSKGTESIGFCESVSTMLSKKAPNVEKMSECDYLEKHTLVEAEDLASGFCESVSIVSSKNMLNVTHRNECSNSEKQAAVKAGNLVSGFCESVSTMPSKNILNVSDVSDYDAAVKAENLGFYESVTTLEVGYCGDSYQSDNKGSIAVANCSVLDVTKMNDSNNLQNSTNTKNLVQQLSQNAIEVEHCNTSCQVHDKESVAMINDVCHNSPAGEIRSGVKNKLNVDQEMVSRKQRRINKHSKKRKRRMRKKQKMSSSAPSREKGGRKEVSSSASSQIKSRNGLRSSAGSSVVSPDWDDSDEDLCIVFDDEVYSAHCVVPKNVNSQSAIIKENSDLWIEFDSLAIVSGSGNTSVNCRSYSSEISIQYDSDSDIEYETDSGQIFVDTDDFDSFSGLVFLSDTVDGCSVLPSQPYVHCQSFTSCTTSYEQVDDCVELYEVNKRWQEVMSDINGEPRLPQRVTFAPEEELVAVFPVEMFDRKSEWEQFAVERFRFKRRVDKFEKLIAPYLTSAHREKTFRRLTDAAS